MGARRLPAGARVSIQHTARLAITGAQMREVEEAYIQLVLRHTNNNKRRAAKVLGICLRTLHGKLRSVEDRKAQGSSA